jgi:SAM-dependent methyltransferase
VPVAVLQHLHRSLQTTLGRQGTPNNQPGSHAARLSEQVTETGSAGVAYQVTDWLEQFEGSRTGLLKQLGYSALWPLFEIEARRWLRDTTLPPQTSLTVLRERGFPVEARRRWALRRLNVKDTVLLVQGTGSGWDVLTWARYRPKRIIATDLFAFDSWPDIAKYCADRWHVRCEFRQAPLEDHSFLADGSVDMCASDAVFEHCCDLPGVLRESRRVLGHGGRLYASYGPLWFGGAGDHYSGRGGLEHLFNHLILPPDEYSNYVERYREGTEGFQDGHRFIQLDLFSKLTTGEYLRAYREAGFDIDALVVVLSSDSLRFRRLFPSRFERVSEATREKCSTDDLLIGGNLVKLTRP